MLLDFTRAALYWIAAMLLSFLVGCLMGCASDEALFLRYSGSDSEFIAPPAVLVVHVIAYDNQFDLRQACKARGPSIACADIGTNTCTLHILNPVTQLTLGHEFRHCLVGRFHD